MRGITRWRPSPATVIASIALLVALSGTSYAAFGLAPHSVGNLQLKTGAVNSRVLLNHGVRKIDLAPGVAISGPAGPAGPAGSAGPAGPTGPTGPSGAGAAKAWAVVKADGSLVRQSGVSSVSHTGTGRYTVGFGSDISACAWIATITNTDGGTQTVGEVTTNKDTNSTVRVATSAGGIAADEDFAIAAFC